MILHCYVASPEGTSSHHRLLQASSNAARFIVNAANLIAPVIEKTEVLGYDWVTWQIAMACDWGAVGVIVIPKKDGVNPH